MQSPTPSTELEVPSSPHRVSIAAHPVLDADDDAGGGPRRLSMPPSANTEPRKSILLHRPSQDHHLQPPTIYLNGCDVENGKPPSIYSDRMSSKRQSTASSYQEKQSQHVDDWERSWWFLLFKRCHQEETVPSWQPRFWPRLCPQPLCPSYRRFARVLALIFILLLSWGIIYCIIGDDAAPGGQLFGMAALTLTAYVGGCVAAMLTLPALVGMLLVGIAFQNLGLVSIEGGYVDVAFQLKKMALVIILTRAGLDLDPRALKKLALHVLKLGVVPWTVECCVIAVMTHYLLGLPWNWGFLLGSVVAAVAPAVVVLVLIRLRNKGYGVAKGIPTLIIAVAGIDDAASVTVFGVMQSIMFSQDSLAYQIAQGPVCVFGGIGFGILWGLLAKYVPEKDDPYVVPLRVLMLLGGGMIAVFGSEAIGFDGAGPLGCLAAAFVCCVSWTSQGMDVEDNPVATAFEIFWAIFEPILFGLTGTQIKFNELDGEVVSLVIPCLLVGIVVRILATVLVSVGSKLNLKEKMFVSLAWMAKATVQAALSSEALNSVEEVGGSADELRYGQLFEVTCVLSILLAAPVCAVAITLSGPRLLTRTSTPPPEAWRRSARPSLRDISIFEEDEDTSDQASTAGVEEQAEEKPAA